MSTMPIHQRRGGTHCEHKCNVRSINETRLTRRVWEGWMKRVVVRERWAAEITAHSKCIHLSRPRHHLFCAPSPRCCPLMPPSVTAAFRCHLAISRRPPSQLLLPSSSLLSRCLLPWLISHLPPRFSCRRLTSVSLSRFSSFRPLRQSTQHTFRSRTT